MQAVSLPFELVLQDSGSSRAQVDDRSAPFYCLLLDGTAWEDHWRDISTEPVPPVRFDREVVLCISMGTQRTGGFSVELEEVRFEPREQILHCTLQWSEPQAGGFQLQALTAPRSIYRIVLPAEARLRAPEALRARFFRAGPGEEFPVDLMRLP